MKCVIFAVLIIVAAAMAAPQGDTCSPIGGLCHVYEDCCRDLVCLGYAAKCVNKGGLIVPGEDKRPLSPGPYLPRVPKEYLP